VRFPVAKHQFLCILVGVGGFSHRLVLLWNGIMELTVSFFINGHLRERKRITTPCTIGRSKDVNWMLAHPVLSRIHCELYEEGGELYLRDNASLNGTFFRGSAVEQPVRLSLGDQFAVGSELMFQVLESIPEETLPRELAEQPTAGFTEEELVRELGLATVMEKPMDVD
jgi:predicted component of type VI protein secretion system